MTGLAVTIIAPSVPANAAPETKQDAKPAPSQAQATVSAATAATAAAERKLEIDTARARCTALLATISAVTIQKEPIEDGSCGDLAPVELVSVGKNPAVTLSPPAILNCDMAVAIHNWMKTDVQPLAKKHLGKEVVKLETMSSYSCRNAYGRTLSKLSEHGKANALDIRGFVTASGQPAYVLTDWGLTSGEIRAAAAAAEKEQTARLLAEKAQIEAGSRALAAAKAAAASNQTASRATTTNPIAGAGTIIEGLPKPAITFGNSMASRPSDFGLNQPSRLGGPKPPARSAAGTNQAAAPTTTTPASQNAATATSLFLRAVHDSACQRFSTTLGPETNAAHRNHLHVDLARRNTAKVICE